MNEWEVHALRNLISNVRMLVKIHARAANRQGHVQAVVAMALDSTVQDMWKSHLNNQWRAFFDREYRTRASRWTT